MTKNILWDRDSILKEIILLADKNDGIAISSNASSRLRQCVINEFGSWGNACKIVGVSCPSFIEKRGSKNPFNHKLMYGDDRGNKADLAAGIMVRNDNVSICFNCARSGAPKSIRCSWDEKLILPKGCVYCLKQYKNDNKVIKLPVILYCPNFMNNNDLKFYEKVKLERKKCLEKAIEEKFGGINLDIFCKGGV